MTRQDTLLLLVCSIMHDIISWLDSLDVSKTIKQLLQATRNEY